MGIFTGVKGGLSATRIAEKPVARRQRLVRVEGDEDNSELEASNQSLPQGFKWGAVRAGIKASGNLDVAVAVADKVANAAAMFTRNQVVAAPVTVGRRHLLATGGRVGAVLVNAGNANCATGQAGIDACVQTCVAAAETFQCIFDEVFPSSTGIIGVPFPGEKVIAALPAVNEALGSTSAHAELFAKAIMTTDTRMKVSRAVVDVDGAEVCIFGAAKGAGMIHPQLGAPVGPPHATMLVYLFTDLAAESRGVAGAAGAGSRAELQLHIDRRRYARRTTRCFCSQAEPAVSS